MVYSEDDKGNPKYNFWHLDAILDIILSNGCQPYMSCCYMPDALATEPKIRRTLGQLINPPKDYAKWSEMLCQVARHCIERYGLEEVRTWYWDCWNEPDLKDNFILTENFFKVYDFFAQGTKRADSRIRIGGPTYTLATKDTIRRFLNHCVSGTNYATGKVGAPIDFVSWHIHETDPDALIRENRALSDTVSEFPDLLNCAVHISEWNYRNLLPETLEFNIEWQYNSFAASQLCRLISGVVDDNTARLDRMCRLGAFSQWQGYFLSYSVSFGNLDQKQYFIPMTLLNAFILLAKLGTERIELSGSKYGDTVHGFATRSANGVQVLLYNFNEPDRKCQGSAAEVDLTVKGLPTTWTKMKRYQIDAKNSNAFASGYPSPQPGDFNASWLNFTTDAQIIKAEQDAKLKIIEFTDKLKTTDGQATFRLSLPSNAITLIVIGDETPLPVFTPSPHIAQVIQEETAYKAAMAKAVTGDPAGQADALLKLCSDSYNLVKDKQPMGDYYSIWAQKALFARLNMMVNAKSDQSADNIRQRLLQMSQGDVEQFIMLSDRLKYLQVTGKTDEAKGISIQLQAVRSKLEVLANWSNWSSL